MFSYLIFIKIMFSYLILIKIFAIKNKTDLLQHKFFNPLYLEKYERLRHTSKKPLEMHILYPK